MTGQVLEAVLPQCHVAESNYVVIPARSGCLTMPHVRMMLQFFCLVEHSCKWWELKLGSWLVFGWHRHYLQHNMSVNVLTASSVTNRIYMWCRIDMDMRDLCTILVFDNAIIFDDVAVFFLVGQTELSAITTEPWRFAGCLSCGVHPRLSQGWSWHSKGFLEITVRAVALWMSMTSWMNMRWHLCKWLSCSSIVSTSTTF